MDIENVTNVWKQAQSLQCDLRKLLAFTKENNNIIYVWHPDVDEGFFLKIREHLDDELRIGLDEELKFDFEPISLWSEIEPKEKKESLLSLLDELEIQVEEWGELSKNTV